MIIGERAYDVSKFLSAHPGGSKVIMHYAGRDATAEFSLLHRPGACAHPPHSRRRARTGGGGRRRTPPSPLLLPCGRSPLWAAPNGLRIGTLDKFALPSFKVEAGRGVRAAAAAATATRPEVTWAELVREAPRGGGGCRARRRLLTAARAAQAEHTTESDCWLAIHGAVYNVSSFLQDHPAGGAILVKYAGKDATAAFDAAGHPRDIVDKLGLGHLWAHRHPAPLRRRGLMLRQVRGRGGWPSAGGGGGDDGAGGALGEALGQAASVADAQPV